MQRALIVLVVLAVGLPIVVCVLLGVQGLLAAMGDGRGAAVLQRVALGGGVLWAIDLVLLLILMAVAVLLADAAEHDHHGHHHDHEHLGE